MNPAKNANDFNRWLGGFEFDYQAEFLVLRWLTKERNNGHGKRIQIGRNGTTWYKNGQNGETEFRR